MLLPSTTSAQKSRITRLIGNALRLKTVHEYESDDAKKNHLWEKVWCTAQKARTAMIENGYFSHEDDIDTQCTVIQAAIRFHLNVGDKRKDDAWIFGNGEWC